MLISALYGGKRMTRQLGNGEYGGISQSKVLSQRIPAYVGVTYNFIIITSGECLISRVLRGHRSHRGHVPLSCYPCQM